MVPLGIDLFGFFKSPDKLAASIIPVTAGNNTPKVSVFFLCARVCVCVILVFFLFAKNKTKYVRVFPTNYANPFFKKKSIQLQQIKPNQTKTKTKTTQAKEGKYNKKKKR